MDTEIWKDVPGYEGLYRVSNTGKVESLNYNHTKKPKILSPGNTILYWNVSLSKNRKYRMFSVHRIVASAFLGLDINDKKMLVCHKDDNGHNNNVDNLFLGSYKDNADDMVSKGRHKPQKKQIIQYGLDKSFIKKWESITLAGETLGLKISNITHCCRGRRRKTGGYIWEYDKVI